MFSALISLRCALQATIRVRSSWIARARRDDTLGALLYVACMSPMWSTVSIEKVPFGSVTRVTGRELLFSGTSLHSVLVIKDYVVGLYLPGRAENATVVLGMKDPKRLQIRPLRNVGADTFICALNDGIHHNQTGIQTQELADRLTQSGDAMRQIDSTRHGDTIDFDYVPSAGTTISINSVTCIKATPGGNLYQAVLSVFISNSPVDRKLRNGPLRS